MKTGTTSIGCAEKCCANRLLEPMPSSLALPLSSVTADTPCVHCGLPVGKRPVGDDPFFCCTGCALVYQTLHDAGYGDTFYRLRDLTPDTGRACPAPTAADPLLLTELDSPAFLETQTREAGQGLRHVDLFLDGVHCAACVWLVERLPYELDGVVEARLDLPRARLSVSWDPDRVLLSDIARWLAHVGYTAHPTRAAEQATRTRAEQRLLIKMGVSWALAGNVMLLAFAFYAGLDLTHEPALATTARWLSLLLALPAVLYGGSEFFRRAWVSLRQAARSRSLRHLHMDTPIALGILTGFTHSTWATVSGRGDVWFDSITVLIAALLTARWLQLRSRRLAGDASERLLSLIPTMLRKVKPDGTVEIVRADEVFPEDLVEVPPGEVIPVDGRVETGVSSVNNAVLTGESRPEPLRPGDPVSAGATNIRSPLRIRVRATGEATRVGRLLAWVRNASTHQAPVVLMADRIGGYFVLSVLLLAALTGLIWSFLAPEEALLHVVALLVVTCPCALGMATPLAMAVGAGKAARAGIFIKTDEATQQLERIDCVVLDKTGTLTEGTMTLAAVEGSSAAIDLAAALERHSNHPLATALLQAYPATDAPVVTDLHALAGFGLQGRVDGHCVVVGRPDWVAALNEWPQRFDGVLHRFLGQAYSPVAVAVDGEVRALLGFGDALRADSRSLITRFLHEGKAVYVLSGDHEAVVQSVAQQLGLSAAQAHGGFGPEEKQAFIETLRQQEGYTVAMIGDGVNDAAALQAADVGIAVHGGSTASLVAADAFLTRPGLQPLAELFEGAGKVMNVIRRNLRLSLIYNVLGAAAAMAGLVSPLLAALAMPVSSLVVVLSSVTQRSFSTRSQ